MNLERWREQHPLEGPVLKLNRAEEHLKAIDRYLDRFYALDPHRMNRKLNADKTFYEYRLIATFPPFLDFGLLLGEFCYQVRSALDHIIYALAVCPDSLSERRREGAERETSFPISPVANDSFIDGALRWIPDNIRSEVRAIVDEVQPYKRGDRNAALVEPLALLHQLCLIDKHRVFRPLEVRIHIDRTDLAPGITTIWESNAGHGDIFARVPAHLNPEIDFDPRVTGEVVLPKVWTDKGYTGVESLRVIHNRVRNTILPRFVRFFDPLPPSIQI